MNVKEYSTQEIREVIDGFESATIPLSDFKHDAHLMIAVSYLLELSFDEALLRMRAGLKTVLARNGIEGYNETITVFWMKYAKSFLSTATAGLTQAELTNLLLSECSGQWLINEFYSSELLSSEEARQFFVVPDLKPLPWGEA
jgi:hypothetical protein